MQRRRKRTVKLLAGLIVCSICSQSVSEAAAAGDLNKDNTVNLTDLSYMRTYLLDQSPGNTMTDFSEADFNSDQKTDVLDYVLMRNSVIKNCQQSNETSIHLNGTEISVEGENAVLNDKKNVVTITASGTYYIDGTLSDGQICVNVPDIIADPGTVKLFFNGVDITGVNEAPLYIENAENTSVNLKEGTTSYLSDGPVYSQTQATVFAKDDITFKGAGTLKINAQTQYGIHCNNDVKINGCNLTVNTLTADAIRGKKSVEVKDGNIIIDSESDGIKSTKGEVNIVGGTLSIKAGADAIQAETSLNISGGSVNACGDRGLTGVESVNITGGTLLATSTELQCENIQTVTVPSMLLNYTTEWLKNNPLTLMSQDNMEVLSVNTLKKFRYAFIASDNLSQTDNYSLYIGGIKTDHSGSDVYTAGYPSVYNDINNTDTSPVLYDSLFDQSVVHEVKIDMPQNDWNDLIANANDEVYHAADVTVDGELFRNVGVRTKGNSSLTFVTSAGKDKYSLRINFDKYDKYQNYHGLTEICLNNMYSDPSCMRDILCYNSLSDLGGYAPKTSYSDLYVNGSLYSFYFMAEQPDKTLAERYATKDDANLYKASAYSCSMEQNQAVTDFELKFGKDESLSHIGELINAVNNVTPGQTDQLEQLMDVESFLKGFAVNAVLCNYDSYNGMMAHNYYLVYNEGKFHYVGWDYNLALGNFMDYGASAESDIKTGLYNIDPQSRPMITNLLKIDKYNQLYLGYVKEILDQYQDPDETVNSIAAVIRDHVYADQRFFFTPEQFEKNIVRSSTGLVVSQTGGGMWGGFGGFGGIWGGQTGSLFSYGGENVSIVDFMVKRFEVIRNSIGY